MRISGGTAKGRKTAPKRLLTAETSGGRLRPTSSKVREALFDIVGNRLDGAVFADLYAGTGTVGLEALSRGAREAFFVEPDESRFGAIKHAVSALGFEDRAHLIKGVALGFLKTASSGQRRMDIIFLDPPYHSEEVEEVLTAIGEGEVLSEGGIVVLEHFSKKKVTDMSGRLRKERSYKYGDSMLTLYRKAEI
jgi:16S rRNA (guanine966-N2)-methyltransferase